MQFLRYHLTATCFCIQTILIVLFTSCRSLPPGSHYLVSGTTVKVHEAGLATAHPEATKIGIDILRQGGNAIDAAIATQFALSVCFPIAGNIGGGGFMLIRTAKGKLAALDFRERAPGLASQDMYLNEEGEVVSGMSLNGHLAVGVPGTVDGMVNAFENYSRLKNWDQLLQPSIDLARNGFSITHKQAGNFNESMDLWKKLNTRQHAFIRPVRWQAGDILIQEDLARTLEAIRDRKRSGFYSGWVADSLIAEMQRGGGLINHNDLINYKSVWREPVKGTYRNYNIISMPPPSSGGIALIQILNILELYDIASMGFQSKQSIHHIAEASRRVFSDRASHLGDPDFYAVPQTNLVSKDYAAKRMNNFDEMRASQSKNIAAGDFPYESEQTTHFSIIDNLGNAVSLTTTLNTQYGSKVLVGGAGFFLNNEMDDLSAKPGSPNYFGLIGAEANSIAPGKRPLSSMTPTIVTEKGKVKIIVGSPGGSKIITSVLQTILNIVDFDMTAEEAVTACRFHHQWVPDYILKEENCFSDEIINSLNEMGHEVRSRSAYSRVEAILIHDDGTIEIAADPRGDDRAMGY